MNLSLGFIHNSFFDFSLLVLTLRINEATDSYSENRRPPTGRAGIFRAKS